MGSSPNLLDFLNDSPTISLPPVDPNVLAPVPAMAPSPQWCEKCYKQAQDVEQRHMKSSTIIKKKIIFTDNLIGMYTQMKTSLEQKQAKVKSLEQECKRKEADNQLINKQLKALLDEQNCTKVQKQKEETDSLKLVVEMLNDKIKSMEMTSRMLEDKIESLKEEQNQREIDWKKHNKEKDQLQKEIAKHKKTIASLKKENAALNKKNETLQERIRKRRSRGSGSFSHTTDSEHNTTLLSDDHVKTETEENSSIFKSPLPGKKKKLKRKRRKSQLSEASDEEETNVVKVENPIEESEIENNVEPEPPGESDVVIPKERQRNAKANWLSSSSDTPSDPVKPVVASRDMKVRLLEVKRKRAYRSFCSHPSKTQMKELSEIVARMNEKSFSMKEEAERFCSKHHLTGHESLVIRKVEKLRQESSGKVDTDLTEHVKYNSIVDTHIVDGLGTGKMIDTPPENNVAPPVASTDIFAAADSVVKTLNSLPKSLGIEIKDITEANSGEKSVDITHQTPLTTLTLPCMTETTQPATSLTSDIVVQTPTVSSSTPAIPDDIPSVTSVCHRNNAEEPATSVITNETTTMTSSTTKVVSQTAPAMSSSPVKHTSLERENEKDILNDLGNTGDVIHPQIYSSMFSSDDTDEEQVKVKIQSVTYSEAVKKVEKIKRRMRTRSISISLSETQSKSDADVPVDVDTFAPVEKDDKVLIDENTSHSSSNEEAKPPSINEFSSDSSDSDSLPLKVIQNRKRADLSQKNKHASKKSATDTKDKVRPSTTIAETEPSSKKTKASKEANMKTSAKSKRAKNNTIKEENHTTVTKRKLDPKSPEIDSKISKLCESSAVNKQQPNLITKPSDQPISKHRVLASLQSLPFHVEDEDSHSLSPKHDVSSYSFIPSSSNMNDLSDDETSSSSSDKPSASNDSIMSPTNLNTILQDMATMMSIEPLSPLGGGKESSSDDNFAFDLDDDDSRLSISPSSNLCTAISFSSSVTKVTQSCKTEKAAIATTAIQKTDALISQKKLLDLPSVSDAPRRFSCEAPSLARTIPTVKRVCKAQSLDPSALQSGGPKYVSVVDVTSADTTPLSPIQSEPSSKILPSNIKIVTPTYSGPFKVVASASPITSPIEKSAQDVMTSHSLQESTSKAPSNALITSANSETVVISETASDNICSDVAEKPNNANTAGDIAPLAMAPEFEDDESLTGQVANFSFSRMLQEIQCYAVIKHPSKTYSTIPFLSIVRWLTHVIKASHVHVAHRVVSDFRSSNGDLSNLQLKDLLHEWEYEFVMMIITVDKIRSKYNTGIIESLVVPVIMKLLSRFGNCIYSSTSFVMDDEVANQLGFLLRKGKLSIAHTCALVRILSSLCRSVGYAKGVLDFCRYAILLKPIASADSLVYDCIASYPQAFSETFPKSGKILTHSLALYAEQYKYMDKSEQFKDDIRTRVHHLEMLLGWDNDENSVLLNKKKMKQVSSAEENLMMEAKWSKVFAQCLSAIGNAKLIEVSVRPQSGDAQCRSPTLALNVKELDDVFSTLELLVCLKSLSFATAEVIDKKFWPWLNAWSRHLVNNPNQENKPVSDACVMAVLHGFAVVLTVVILKQKVRHPNQKMSKQLVSYFEVICALLSNFTLRHLKTAPFRVQCATAVTVFKLSFCNPVLAYKSLFDWFKASLVLENEGVQSKTHPLLPHIVTLYPEKSMRKMVAWLHSQNRTTRQDQKYASISLTTLIWG